ncbi:hypothetical protein [Candidatus Electrothrix sp.]|uniref:hypothetical protein n=1 Tax=Candidatus Electrothrix sp. TaxID=2170559 RepID=UPI0040564B64
MAAHDNSYKILFSHARMVEDLLLDEGSYTESELEPLVNLSAALFRLENSRTHEDIQQVLITLTEWLSDPKQTSLRRAFTV